MIIDAGAQVTIILLTYGPCVVIVNLLGQVCTLGRVPHTKETLLDFREWCRVTRHSRVFRGLTGCQWTPGFWAVTVYLKDILRKFWVSFLQNFGTKFVCFKACCLLRKRTSLERR